ncbi:hypothetical protein [Streptomyces solicathayae]|uniref:Hydrogenase expression protein HypF n=1 Tax=Streptomyces solicathayae TaxID=3081768 RepID=A0ABZ0LRR3_9ACTN|nr:hypothetical protein [Streptomyces sp. HUAS YS2]WOX21995.1 hypothetical protein R2D22_11570 [Streptomyces sp. HUAS YS2]
MRGDETQSATAGEDATLARKGPRHAAPRKSLLNKLQVPAGKAMALAAMPTAVLVGMGLTPKLALADEKDIPFAPGPCVTRSDEPVEESKSPEPTKTPEPSASSSETGKDDSADKTPEPTASPSASATTDKATTEERTTSGATAPSASPSPTPTKSVNPLDPLGVGDKIKDLFDGPDEPTATPTPTASTEPTAEPTPTAKPTDEPTSGASKPALDDASDRTKDAIKDAADKAGATVKELGDDAKGLDVKKDTDIPEEGKPRFPCPTPDPQALAAADLEEGAALVPDEPWILDSTLLTLKGLKYHGIVEVKTGSGKIKKVLKFTASNGVDIKDLHQKTVHSDGYTGHVRSDRGSTSTMRDGTVTMYTEQLKGNLFGLIPVTFNPETPPPLDVPFAFFTNVEVIQAGQFGGTLRVPGLRNTIEPN